METDNQNGMDYNEEEVCQTQAALKVDKKNNIECSEEEVSQTPEALKADNHNKEEVCKKKQIIKVKNTNSEEKQTTIQMIKGVSTFSEKLEEILLRLIHDQEELCEKIEIERKAREGQVGQLQKDLNDKAADLEKGLSDLGDKLDKEQNDFDSRLEELSKDLRDEDQRIKEDMENRFNELGKELQENKEEMAANQNVLIEKLDSINGDLETAVEEINGKLNSDIQDMKNTIEQGNSSLNDLLLEERNARLTGDDDLNKRLSDLRKDLDDVNADSTNQLSEIEASLSKKIDTDLGEVKSDMGILGGKLDFGLSGLDKKIEELDLKFEGALQEEKDVNVGRVNDLKMALEEEKLLRVQDIEIAKNNLLEKIQEERSALEDKNAEVIKMIDEDREDLAHLGKKIDGEKRERGKLLSELEYKIEDDLSKCTNKINTDIGAMREDLEKESAQNKADSQKIHSDMDALHDLVLGQLNESGQNIKDLLKEEEANRIKNDEEIRAVLEEYKNQLDGSDSDREAGIQALRDELASSNNNLENSLQNEINSLNDKMQSQNDGIQEQIGGLKDEITASIDGIVKDMETEKLEREKSGQDLNKAIEDKVNGCINDIKTLEGALEEKTSGIQEELNNAVANINSELTDTKDLIAKEGETRSVALEGLKSVVDQNNIQLESDLNALKNQIETNKDETANFVDAAMAKVTDNLSSIDSLLRNDLENLNSLVKEVKAETLDAMVQKVAQSIDDLDGKLSGRIESDVKALDESVGQKIAQINSDLDLLKGSSQNESSNLCSQLSALKADLDGQKEEMLGKISTMDEEMGVKMNDVSSDLNGKLAKLDDGMNKKMDALRCSLEGLTSNAIQKLSDEIIEREGALEGTLIQKVEADRLQFESDIGILKENQDMTRDAMAKDLEQINQEVSHRLSDLDKKLDDEEKCIKDTIQAMNSDLISKISDDFESLNQSLEKESAHRENLENELKTARSSDMSDADKLRLEIQGVKEVIYDNKLKGGAELENIKNMMQQDKADMENKLNAENKNVSQKVGEDLSKMQDLLKSLEEEKKRLASELSKLNDDLNKKLSEGSKELEDLIQSENKNLNDRLEVERKLLEDQLRKKNNELTKWLQEEKDRSESNNASMNEELNLEKAKQAKLADDNKGLLEGLESMKKEIGSRQREIESLREELGHEKTELLKSNLKLSDLLNNETMLRQEQMELQEEKAKEISGLLQKQGQEDDIRYKTIKEDLFKLRQEVVRPLSVCFNASRSIPYTKGGEEYLTFSSCSLNYGDAFDPSSGIFVAPISGIYLLAIHVCTHDLKKALISIRRNGSELATLYDQNHVDNHKNSMAGQAILAELSVGDKVQVYLYTFTGLHDKEGNHLTQFMGILMKPLENLVVSHESKKSEPVYAVPENKRRVIMSQEPA